MYVPFAHRDLTSLFAQLIGLIFTNAGDAANCDLVAIDPGAGMMLSCVYCD
jgi:hypothetical protein